VAQGKKKTGILADGKRRLRPYLELRRGKRGPTSRAKSFDALSVWKARAGEPLTGGKEALHNHETSGRKGLDVDHLLDAKERDRDERRTLLKPVEKKREGSHELAAVKRKRRVLSTAQRRKI